MRLRGTMLWYIAAIDRELTVKRFHLSGIEVGRRPHNVLTASLTGIV
jgi:hypothetical protein